MITLSMTLTGIGAVTAAAAELDPTFGVGGKITTSFEGNAYLGGMTLQADGKIVAVGNAFNGTDTDWRIARYGADGALDASFGTAGIVTADFGGDDNLDTVAVQPDGKILVGGYSRPTGTARWTVARYNTNGTIDTGFGSSGIAATLFSGMSSNLLGIARQPDGKIVATGYTNTGAGHDDVAVARYHNDGSPDLGFGSSGFVTTPISTSPTPNDRGNAIAVQPDGKLVVFGDFDASGHDDVFLLRYNANGTLDTGFGSGGRITDSFLTHNGARDLKLQADGKIVVTGGAVIPGPGDTYIARYGINGAPDTGFGSGGSVITSFSADADSSNALAIRPDGKILVAGYEGTGSAQDSAVRQFNPDGTLDTSFGTNGSLVIPLSSADDNLSAIAEQQDGKIVVAGAAHEGASNAWALARLSEGPFSSEFTASADTYVRSGQANKNEGSAALMVVRASGDNRSVVRFDQAAMEAEIGGGTVLAAKLRLTITDNGNNWGSSGRPVGVHRVLVDWAEGNGTESDRGTGSGATWNCAVDGQIANQAKNCTGAAEWEMGQPGNPSVHPWAEPPTETQIITNNQSGVIEYDVTADVAEFLDGTNPNFGWLIKKSDESQNGMIAFGTRESMTAPRLVITWMP
ncbi:hypothetical protein Aple_022870 [Acrocarpospora pleiomorpha]|uniref:Uncharacterized protein n=1 Tax=Acrocarpospora pleiomorpha TaxID=90975 RepID=A0A5M3XI77_9ACTN|nr:DNRLRE domain-containing protein [Acrocarpospora pleiomorpha]GES19391.1 hypothetical protein Aple_022870 [Acrocarpospora pleiomorpha]